MAPAPQMKAEIWHVKEDKFAEAMLESITGEFTLEFPQDYTHVGSVDLNNHGESQVAVDHTPYEAAFFYSQNGEESWHPEGKRSTSVGDVVVIEGVAKRIANVGFKEL